MQVPARFEYEVAASVERAFLQSRRLPTISYVFLPPIRNTFVEWLFCPCARNVDLSKIPLIVGVLRQGKGAYRKK